MFDEKWAEKQARGFTKLINFIFEAAEEDSISASPSVTNGPKQIVNDESHALKILVAKRKEGVIRRNAVMLFHSADMDRTCRNIEREVDEGKISIRVDRHLYADVGLREEFMTIILSYNPHWLVLGLETVFGELLCVDRYQQQHGVFNNDALVKVIRRFIVERLLNDPVRICLLTYNLSLSQH